MNQELETKINAKKWEIHMAISSKEPAKASMLIRELKLLCKQRPKR